MNHSARRINALMSRLGSRRYLEIGVSTGATFRDVAIAERTGVDPAFAFDTDKLCNESTRFISKRSDAFFASEPLCPAYDIVFIDGMHTFEQVVRDLSNVILRIHSRSVILLDDTLPDDVYSSFPKHADTIRHRTAAHVRNESWHGDVFKAVFYIHDFWPSLNYRTISGAGNSQTLIWPTCGVPRPPIFDNLEKISRLTYFDLQDHLDVLRLATEEVAIKLCLEEIL